MSETVLGVDFGTTNSVAAQVDRQGIVQPLVLRAMDKDRTGLRSTLSFREDPESINQVEAEAGEVAIDRFIENPEDTRFLQSIKTYAASKLFSGTRVHRKHFDFEDLLS